MFADALDFDLMVDTLRKLKDGKHVEVNVDASVLVDKS